MGTGLELWKSPGTSIMECLEIPTIRDPSPRIAESGFLTDDQVAAGVSEGLAALPVDGRRVLVIIPDGTRTMPMPVFFDLIDRELGPRVRALDWLIALGTH